MGAEGEAVSTMMGEVAALAWAAAAAFSTAVA